MNPYSIFEREFFMSKLKKQLYSILGISGLNAFQLAGASWIALLAARGFSLV